MNPHFHVGEIAIIANSGYFPEYIGSECTVIGELADRVCLHPTIPNAAVKLRGYQIQCQDGCTLVAPPEALRKRHEPGDWANLRDIFQPRSRECEA